MRTAARRRQPTGVCCCRQRPGRSSTAQRPPRGVPSTRIRSSGESTVEQPASFGRSTRPGCLPYGEGIPVDVGTDRNMTHGTLQGCRPRGWQRYPTGRPRRPNRAFTSPNRATNRASVSDLGFRGAAVPAPRPGRRGVSLPRPRGGYRGTPWAGSRRSRAPPRRGSG